MMIGRLFNTPAATALVLFISFGVRHFRSHATTQEELGPLFGWDVTHDGGPALIPFNDDANTKHLVFKKEEVFAVESPAVDSAARALGKLDWGIAPQEGYPRIAFSDSTTDQEIVFKYDTSPLYEGKTFVVTVFQQDCETIAASGAITSTLDSSVDQELTVLLDIDQGKITDSEYYSPVNNTIATIRLCLRVEYYLGSSSVNFHETIVTVSVDFRVGFELTGIAGTLIILPRSGFPQIAVDKDTGKEEIFFKFSVPPLSEGRSFVVTILLEDCETLSASGALSSKTDVSVAREVSVEVIIDESVILSSEYYFPARENATKDLIGFCLRLDFVSRIEPSRRLQTGDATEVVSSYETVVEIEIDLTNSFDLVKIAKVKGTGFNSKQDNQESLEFDVSVTFDLPVIAYYCDLSGSKLATPSEISQGDAVHFCVEIDPLYVLPSFYVTDVYVTDIFSAELVQQQEDLTVSRSEFISSGVADGLTEKVCQAGICNVKTALTTELFNYTAGIAIVAFGKPSDRTRQRFLRVPTTFQHSSLSKNDRRLVEGVSFILAAPLAKATIRGVPPVESSANIIVMVGATVAGVVAVFLIIQWRRRSIRRKSKQNELPKSKIGWDVESMIATDQTSTSTSVSDPKHTPNHSVHVAYNMESSRSKSFDSYDDVPVQRAPGPTKSFEGFLVADPPRKPVRHPSFDGDVVTNDVSSRDPTSSLVSVEEAPPWALLRSPSFVDGADSRRPPTPTRSSVAPLNGALHGRYGPSQSFDGYDSPAWQPPGTIQSFVASQYDASPTRTRSRTATDNGSSVPGRHPPPPSRSYDGCLNTVTPLTPRQSPSFSLKNEGEIPTRQPKTPPMKTRSDRRPPVVSPANALAWRPDPPVSSRFSFVRNTPSPSRSIEGSLNVAPMTLGKSRRSPSIHASLNEIPFPSPSSARSVDENASGVCSAVSPPRPSRARRSKSIDGSEDDIPVRRPPTPSKSFDGAFSGKALRRFRANQSMSLARSDDVLVPIPSASSRSVNEGATGVPSAVTPPMRSRARRSKSMDGSEDDIPVRRPPTPSKSFDGVLSGKALRRYRASRSMSLDQPDDIPIPSPRAPSRSVDEDAVPSAVTPPRRSRARRSRSMDGSEDDIVPVVPSVRRPPASSQSFDGYLHY